jgi:hypothetical protein
MHNKIQVAKLSLINIAGDSANYVVAASAAAGLSEQLHQTHNFLYLDLPLWLFFAAVLLLSAIGSLGSLYIDMMSDSDLKPARMVVNLVLGFLTGVIGAFVVLPAITAKPPLALMLITALIMSLIGTVLVKNIGDLLRSASLWQALKEIAMEALMIIKKLLIERLKLLLAVFFGGGGK